MNLVATNRVDAKQSTGPIRNLHLLSRLLLGKDRVTPDTLAVERELQMMSRWSEEELAQFFTFADLHHVLARALGTLLMASDTGRSTRSRNRLTAVLTSERERISLALSALEAVCGELESEGCSAIVIKSLDHWPDLGSDLDLYTGGSEDLVTNVMTRRFAAEILPRSWGDRLAHKWNFRLPGLPEPIEIHAGRLGQTGEHLQLSRRVALRSVTRTVAGLEFRVPAPEERVMITTLQRMYRHFYCRLCDIVDTAKLIESRQLDYAELQAAAEASGIWPGVAAFLQLVANYAATNGAQLTLPAAVVSSATPVGDLRLRGNFLRIPIVPQAARLFLSQVLYAGSRGNVRTVSRLSLLPGLAAAAFVAYKITGNDKGIW